MKVAFGCELSNTSGDLEDEKVPLPTVDFGVTVMGFGFELVDLYP